MTKYNDNRMGWIRNIDQLKESDTQSYCAEYEIASEVYIPGILNYMNEKILCGLMTFNKDQRGLYKYLLKIKYAFYEGIYDKKKSLQKGTFSKKESLEN